MYPNLVELLTLLHYTSPYHTRCRTHPAVGIMIFSVRMSLTCGKLIQQTFYLHTHVQRTRWRRTRLLEEWNQCTSSQFISDNEDANDRTSNVIYSCFYFESRFCFCNEGPSFIRNLFLRYFEQRLYLLFGSLFFVIQISSRVNVIFAVA